jgi:hypothetical protein
MATTETWADFLAQIRADVRDPAGATFADVTIAAATGEGLEWMSRTLSLFTDDEVCAIGTTAGTDLYAKPNGTLRLLDIFIGEAHTPLRRVSLEELAGLDLDKAGQPTVFVEEAESFRLWPVPDAAYALRLTRVMRVDFSANADSYLPLEYHDQIGVLRDFVRARLWEQEDRFDRANYFRQSFEAGLRRLRATQPTGVRDRPSLTPMEY